MGLWVEFVGSWEEFVGLWVEFVGSKVEFVGLWEEFVGSRVESEVVGFFVISHTRMMHYFMLGYARVKIAP